MVSLAVIAVVTIAGSFVCSLAEAAMLASSEARIRARVEEGESGASRVLRLKLDLGRTIAAIVLLNNIFQIAGSMVMTWVAATGDTSGVAMLVLGVVLTLAIILFGEILPKVIGEAHPEGVAIALAPALGWARFLLTPFVHLAERLISWARPKSRPLPGEEREIRELARLGEEGGHLASHEAEIIHRVFRLDDISARDVMTPRPLVRAFRAADTLESAKERLFAANHGFFPVYEDDLDKVVGVLSLRDAMAALVRGEGQRTFREIMKPAWFLPSSRRVDDVLRDFQAGHHHMAVVIDEYGVTLGIVTMDDLVEELVGEAIGETIVQEGLVKRLSRTTALVHGLTRVYDVARFLNCTVEFEDSAQETVTVTGVLQERLGRIPETGDVLVLPEDLQLEVKEADGRIAVRVLARNVSQPLAASRG